jgi:hypothetical protein
MKISLKNLAATSVLAVIILSFTLVAIVRADNDGITDQQIQRIRANCLSAKSTLNQLHASDALLRVNRGQTYESMSIKLMSKFNTRVANNQLDNKEFVSITEKYNSILNDFRNHYINYEEHLSSAIAIDCLKKPVSFFDAISVANNDRIKVHKDITKLNQAIDQYRATLIRFEKDLLSESKGSN